MNNIFTFIIAFFFKGWSLAGGVLSFLLAAFAFLFPFTDNFLLRLAIILSILLLAFLIKVLRQSYEYYLSFLRPIKAKKQILGDGLYAGLNLIVLENPGYLRDNALLTLFSKSSAANQPICILKIIKAIRDENLLAIQLIPEAKQYSIDKYFNEDSRLEGLYAIPLINLDEFLKSECMIGGQDE